MIIPDPVLIPVNVNLSHLSWWGQFRFSLKNPPKYRLAENYIITLDDGTRLFFPKYFELDLASVPRIFWWIPGFSPVGPLRYGAIPHDYGYRYHHLLALGEDGSLYRVYEGYPRDKFDTLLRDVTIEKTGIKFVADAAYKALRRWGHIAWGNYRNHGAMAYSYYNSISQGIP